MGGGKENSQEMEGIKHNLDGKRLEGERNNGYVAKGVLKDYPHIEKENTW